MRILAAAIILLFFYYAAGVVITLLLSILLAYFLDPAVEFLERWRVPRTVGAMIMVLILIAVLVLAGYGLWTRTADFASNWPRYSGVLRQAAVAVESKIRGIEGQVSQVTPGQSAPSTAEARTDTGIVRTLIMRSIWKLRSCPSWSFSCWRESASYGTEHCSCFRYRDARRLKKRLKICAMFCATTSSA